MLTDLPVIRNKSWQILAESHTERTFTGFKDDKDNKVEFETVEIVENPKKKTTKTVHFDLGNEYHVEPYVQKPEPAVLAEVKK